jgi:hypothetical protein
VPIRHVFAETANTKGATRVTPFVVCFGAPVEINPQTSGLRWSPPARIRHTRTKWRAQQQWREQQPDRHALCLRITRSSVRKPVQLAPFARQSQGISAPFPEFVTARISPSALGARQPTPDCRVLLSR